MARRWCQWRPNPSGGSSVCKRLVGDFTSLDLLLKIKTEENPCCRRAIAQAHIYQIIWRKGELITLLSHLPRRFVSLLPKLNSSENLFAIV